MNVLGIVGRELTVEETELLRLGDAYHRAFGRWWGSRDESDAEAMNEAWRVYAQYRDTHVFSDW